MNYIEEDIKNELQIEIYQKRKKQITLLKMGFIEALADLLNFIKKIKFYDLLYKDDIYKINKQILRIFEILSNENPFISILFFSNKIVKLILNEVDVDDIDFYYSKIKLLERYNYKADLEYITSYLINIIKLKDVIIFKKV